MLTTNWSALTPNGRVHAKPRDCSADKDDRKRAARRSFIATNKLRAALHRVEIVQHDSSWCHVRNGEVVAIFTRMRDAIDALR